MRVSPVGFAFETLEKVLHEAKRSAEVTHNHPEGIRGAQATAAAVFLARQGESKDAIRDSIVEKFGYDLSRSVAEIRKTYTFNESCQGTVPEAIIAFLESNSYEEAVRLSISLGGDADTLACIAGGIAEAFHGIPQQIAEEGAAHLDPGLMSTVTLFREKYGLDKG
jgi:ADP-ribosylglycohydrolase